MYVHHVPPQSPQSERLPREPPVDAGMVATGPGIFVDFVVSLLAEWVNK